MTSLRPTAAPATRTRRWESHPHLHPEDAARARRFRAKPGFLLLALGAALLGAACGSGGSSGGGFAILACSLGCGSAGPSAQVSCSITDVAVNQEIRVVFSAPVDLSSVGNASFQVIELATGVTPPGTYQLDPNDDTVLIYRPQLTFDSSGNPIFGLQDGQIYSIRIPAVSVDVGPYVRSQQGRPNETRLACTVVASLGIIDPNPGPPVVEVLVDVVTSYTPNGDPDVIATDQPAQGAIDVFRDSDIKMVFDDLMNPGTLVNPISGQSGTVTVRVDPDGDAGDPGDQLDLAGTFSITLDVDALTTTVVFRPELSFPSAGTDPLELRKIVVTLPNAITDLGGNMLLNSGQTIFVPEVVVFDPVTLGDQFDDTAAEDPVHTGSQWAVNSTLLPGPGGGSGRLGDLVLQSGQTITLDTDFEDFGAIVTPGIIDPNQAIDPATPGSLDPVTGGAFEFAHVRIEPGARLIFSGSRPARLFVRGQANIQGTIDVTGFTPPDHGGGDFLGGVGGFGGPAAAVGGPGGARPDGEAFLGQGGDDNPFDPALYADVNGKQGAGIPFPDALAPTAFVAAGNGGLAWPQPTAANPGLHFPADPSDIDGMQFDRLNECKTRVSGGAGSGGGYGLTGRPGISRPVPFGVDPVTPPPDTAGGDSGALAIDATVMTLDPELGLLRGGSGGGGAGGHLIDTKTNGQPIVADCALAAGGGGPAMILEYVAHSSRGGGGGGGAIQVQAARALMLEGRIAATGGAGGGILTGGGGRPQAGGGGSGGSVLVQSRSVQIVGIPGRIDIAGGTGANGPSGSRGGDGGAGLFRLETFLPLPDLLAEASKVAPPPETLATDFGASPADIISIAEWQFRDIGPSALAGAQSCWLQPTGNFFGLAFLDDVREELGWDMRLRIAGLPDPQSYRGPNDVTGDVPLQESFGDDLDAAPVLVRFQGARTQGLLENPCEVPLSGPDSPLVPGSVTAWVKHPAELNDFFGADETLRPNLVRYVVVWDGRQLGYDLIEGIEDLSIRAQPD